MCQQGPTWAPWMDVKKQPETELILIDGIAYTVPMHVACELLRLRLLVKQPAQRHPLTDEQRKAIAESAMNGHASSRDAVLWAINYTEWRIGAKP